MKRSRNTKIIATLGPSSANPEMIRKLFLAGADVFRINMSHTDHASLQEVHAAIREAEEDVGHLIGILADLQGPKIRVGRFDGGRALLEPGKDFILDQSDVAGTAERAPMPHPEIFSAAEKGTTFLLDDGKIKLRAKEVTDDRIITEIVEGGVLKDRKGVNVPDAVLPISALTEKDIDDLDHVLALGAEWIALSFVQRAEDVRDLKKRVQGRAGVLAKIEKPAALDDLQAIIRESDALMVARGDLGVELPLEEVPGRQKQITRAARAAGKPVVIATQMLESMISTPVPTRAEVSDVATAVFEGADAIMLSAESAAGKYPEEAVNTMDRIAATIEGETTFRDSIDAQRSAPEATSHDAISAAAHQVAHTLQAAAIVCYTTTGSTALRASRERPDTPVLVLTPSIHTGRKLALGWGLTCVLTDDARDFDDMVERACRIAFQQKLAQPGKRIVITAGLPFGTPGATNMLRIARVGTKESAS